MVRAERSFMKEKDRASRRMRAKRRRGWPKAMVAFVIAGSAIIAAMIMFSTSFLSKSFPSAGEARKAALLDGLYVSRPNPAFIENITSLLKDAGFQVDVFIGENVTIELLENIGGYDLLILRLHSAIYIDRILYLFSGEHYVDSKYFFQQLSGIVKKAYTFNESEPPFFALNSAFLGMSRKDGLKNSTIIMMGCNGTGDIAFIQSLFKKGVKAYFAWSGYVNPSHADKATIALVKALYLEALSPREAAEKVMNEIGLDPIYGSQLYCFTS